MKTASYVHFLLPLLIGASISATARLTLSSSDRHSTCVSYIHYPVTSLAITFIVSTKRGIIIVIIIIIIIIIFLKMLLPRSR